MHDSSLQEYKKPIGHKLVQCQRVFGFAGIWIPFLSCILILSGYSRTYALSPLAHQVTYELFAQSEQGNSRPFGTYAVTLKQSCQNWTHESRLVLDIEGTTVSQIYRAQEDLEAQTLQFDHKTRQNKSLIEHIKGRATRFGNGNILVDLKAPHQNSFDLPVKTQYAVQHLQTLLTHADQGRGQTDLIVFEGTSEKAVQIVSEISNPVSVNRFGQAVLDLLRPFQQQNSGAAGTGRVWPIHQSAYLLDEQRNQVMGSDPVYQFEFNLHESGIAVSMVIELSDIVLNGVLSEVRYFDKPRC